MIQKYYLSDKETLKKEAIKYLDIFKDHPYIFNLGHGVLPETDPNMFEYLVNTVKIINEKSCNSFQFRRT